MILCKAPLAVPPNSCCVGRLGLGPDVEAVGAFSTQQKAEEAKARFIGENGWQPGSFGYHPDTAGGLPTPTHNVLFVRAPCDADDDAAAAGSHVDSEMNL